jgi:hypothetical protein
MSAAGFVASLIMKGLPLHTDVDNEWGVEVAATQNSGGEEKSGVEIGRKEEETERQHRIVHDY